MGRIAGKWAVRLIVAGLLVPAPASPAAEGPAPAPAAPSAPADLAADNALRPRAIPAAPSAYAAAPAASLTTWVAKVNGDPVALRFFTRRLAANRAAAYIRFSRASRAAVGPAFWTTKVEGQTPAAWLKQQALDECVRFQVELGMAKRAGLLADTSYAGFLRALDTENERRRTALARGEPIYGPQQYGEDEFFSYLMNNLRLALQLRLADTELHASDEQLRKLYEAVKEEQFSRGARVKVWDIEFLFGFRDGGGRGLTREQAHGKALEAKQRLDRGEPFEVVAADYNQNGDLHEQVFDEESRSADKTQRGQQRDEAMALAEGQTSGVIEEMGAFHILRCLEKDPLGYRPFEEVKDAVQRIFLRQEYAALVDRRAKSAKLVLNRPALAAVEVR